MPQVELTIEPKPSHVRTARQVAVAVGRRLGLAEDTLEEIRLAVGEASGLLIGVHQGAGPALSNGSRGQIEVRIRDDDGLQVAVSTPADLPAADGDAASSVLNSMIPTGDDDLGAAAMVLAVLAEVVPDLSVRTGPDGAYLTLHWPRAAGL